MCVCVCVCVCVCDLKIPYVKFDEKLSLCLKFQYKFEVEPK